MTNPFRALLSEQELIGCAEKMFSKKASKKAPKKADDAEETEDLDPMDLLVDVLIGFMERSSAQLRALATQVFGMLSGEATESTIDLLLAQIEQRPVEADDEADDEDADKAELYDDYAAGEGGLSAEESSEDEDEDLDEEDATAEVDPELRRRIAEALQVNGAAAEPKEDEEEEDREEEEDEDSEDELLMDDDQMLALDDKLAEIFKSQVQAKKGKKGMPTLSCVQIDSEPC
jgi:DNA polymerase phi